MAAPIDDKLNKVEKLKLPEALLNILKESLPPKANCQVDNAALPCPLPDAFVLLVIYNPLYVAS